MGIATCSCHCFSQVQKPTLLYSQCTLVEPGSLLGSATPLGWSTYYIQGVLDFVRPTVLLLKSQEPLVYLGKYHNLLSRQMCSNRYWTCPWSTELMWALILVYRIKSRFSQSGLSQSFKTQLFSKNVCDTALVNVDGYHCRSCNKTNKEDNQQLRTLWRQAQRCGFLLYF